MNEITYLEAIKEANTNGQKPAKISQLKLTTLKGRYHTKCKELEQTIQSQMGSVQDPVVPTAPVVPSTPIVETPVVVDTKLNENVSKDNYQDVIKQFSMTVYKETFKVKKLVGAKKLRVASKVRNNALKMGNLYGTAEIVDDLDITITNDISIPSNVVEIPKKNLEEKTIIVENAKSSDNVVEFPRTQTPQSVTVDDYLQKEIPNQTDGIIIQLTDDVQKLKAAAEEKTALLESLEKKYKELKDKREQRIRDLEDEKLGYTATLEGLTERIRNLQEAIEQEENLIGRKVA